MHTYTMGKMKRLFLGFIFMLSSFGMVIAQDSIPEQPTRKLDIKISGTKMAGVDGVVIISFNSLIWKTQEKYILSVSAALE